MPSKPDNVRLKRSLSLPLVTFFGMGSILGAGIYVLIGEVARVATYQLPFAFLCAAFIAGFTALSYAELVSRMPKSGGEAVYVAAAFQWPTLTRIVGYCAIGTGIVSAATVASGFVGYLNVFIDCDRIVVIPIVVLSLGTIAIVGISASAWTATAMTLIEIGGLLLIVFIAAHTLGDWRTADFVNLLPDTEMKWTAVGTGAFLAFFAFLGFEDMINVAEEVRFPERNMPRAIIIALGASTALYLVVALVALASVPLQDLAGSDAPLSVIAAANGLPPFVMAIIAMIAITNGALIQIVKSARILYGMANLGDAPRIFQRVSPITRTPAVATVVIVMIVLGLALFFPTLNLAFLTSALTLSIFCVVNVALVAIKRRDVAANAVFKCAAFVPVLGATFCAGLLVLQLF